MPPLVWRSFSASRSTSGRSPHWHKPIVPFLYLGFTTAFFLFVRAIYLGRRWARTLTILYCGISLLAFPFTWQEPYVDALYMFQIVLQAVVAISLLLPSSHDWYSQPKKVA